LVYRQCRPSSICRNGREEARHDYSPGGTLIEPAMAKSSRTSNYRRRTLDAMGLSRAGLFAVREPARQELKIGVIYRNTNAIVATWQPARVFAHTVVWTTHPACDCRPQAPVCSGWWHRLRQEMRLCPRLRRRRHSPSIRRQNDLPSCGGGSRELIAADRSHHYELPAALPPEIRERSDPGARIARNYFVSC